MKNISFTDEEKIQIFDEITSHFYNANFGQMSKTDMELMMFRFYIEKMIAENRSEDGSINYQMCSDYRISQDLGITQQRVRNLKVRNQLTNPIEYDWKVALAKLTKHARYDFRTHMVTLNIPDPNLYLEIQNFIEENGAYVDKQLNSKILRLRAEYYINLIVALEPEESRRRIIKRLKKQLKEEGKEDLAFDESNMGKALLDSALNITTVVANLSSIISPQNVVGVALLNLLTGK